MEDVRLGNLTSLLSLAIRLERNAVEGDLTCGVEKNRFRSCESRVFKNEVQHVEHHFKSNSGIPGLKMAPVLNGDSGG